MLGDGPGSFGSWLKARRKGLDLTQQELAGMAGCSIASVRKIEQGVLRPSRQLAELLAAALELPDGEREAFMRFARIGVQEAQTPTPTTTPPEKLQKAAPPRAGLPSPLTPFIGRQRELEQALSLLGESAARLVTFTGPPGIGKTRLSIEVAARLSHEFIDGVFFVPLAPVTNPELVVSTIAQALGVRAASGRPVAESLKEWLQDRKSLLVLDNFEQVVEAAPALADLLVATP